MYSTLLSSGLSYCKVLIKCFSLSYEIIGNRSRAPPLGELSLSCGISRTKVDSPERKAAVGWWRGGRALPREEFSGRSRSEKELLSAATLGPLGPQVPAASCSPTLPMGLQWPKFRADGPGSLGATSCRNSTKHSSIPAGRTPGAGWACQAEGRRPGRAEALTGTESSMGSTSYSLTQHLGECFKIAAVLYTSLGNTSHYQTLPIF